MVKCRTLTPESKNSKQSQPQQQSTCQQEHIALIGLDRSASGDGSFHLKNVRQKLVDNGCGCVFLLHELYGAENKQIANTPPAVANSITGTATVNNIDEQHQQAATISTDTQQLAGEAGTENLSTKPASTATVAPAPVTAAPAETAQNFDDSLSELDDSSGECVVCMSTERDTVLLPCRHLCVCSTYVFQSKQKKRNCFILI